MKGDMILREGEHADSLLFIEDGSIEIFTEFEGNHFLLERLE